MRKKLRIYPIIFILITIIISGCTKKDDKKVISPSITQKKQTVDATGIVKSNNVRNIVIEFPCSAEELNVKEGQIVKAGDNLIKLDLSDYNQKLQSKENEIKNSLLELEKLQNRIEELSSNNPDIKKLQSNISFCENLFNKKLEELASKEKLFNSSVIAKSELDDFRKDVDKTKKDLDDAILALDKLNHDNKIELNTDKAQETSIQNNKIDALRSELDSMKKKLNKPYIKDNFVICDVSNAIVTEIGYSAGDIINPGKKLFTILDLQGLYIDGEVPEEFIKDVKLGAEVAVIPIKDRTKEYKGKVSRISNAAIIKNGQTLIPVEVTMEGNKDLIIVNSNVDLKINIQ